MSDTSLVERLKWLESKMGTYDIEEVDVIKKANEIMQETIAALSAPTSEEVDRIVNILREDYDGTDQQEAADLLQRPDREVATLRAKVAELEEKMDFNERWISQTCETWQIKAERNQNIATGQKWILTVYPLTKDGNNDR